MTGMTAQTAQDLLAEHFAPWVQDLDLTVCECDEGSILVRMAPSERLLRVGGIVSGQALAALADTAMVLAIFSDQSGFVPAATVDLSTSFLRPASGPVEARASVIKAGRLIVFARCELSAGDSGKLVASASATYALPPPR